MLVKLNIPTRLSIQLQADEIKQVTEYAIENDTTFEQALFDMLDEPRQLDIDTLDAIIERLYWVDTTYPQDHALPDFCCNKQIMSHIDIKTQLDTLLSSVAWRQNSHYESTNDFVNVVMEAADEYGFAIEENDKDFARKYIASIAEKYM